MVKYMKSGDHNVFLCSPLHQAFIIEDEEQTRSLPPNPFNEVTEKVLEEYKNMVERKQQGQEGTLLFFIHCLAGSNFTITKPYTALLLFWGTETST